MAGLLGHFRDDSPPAEMAHSHRKLLAKKDKAKLLRLIAKYKTAKAEEARSIMSDIQQLIDKYI